MVGKFLSLAFSSLYLQLASSSILPTLPLTEPRSGQFSDAPPQSSPTQSSGMWLFDPLAILLLLLYLLIGALCYTQFSLIIKARHKTKSIQTGLLSLLILFSIFRIVFIVKTMRKTEWPMTVIFIIYLFPMNLQVSAVVFSITSQKLFPHTSLKLQSSSQRCLFLWCSTRKSSTSTTGSALVTEKRLGSSSSSPTSHFSSL